MANFLYDKAKEKLLNGQINWLSDEFKVCLVSSAYSVNQKEHETLGEIFSTARIAISSALTQKEATSGIAKAADVTISSVPNVVIKALVIFKVAPSLENSPLVAYIDTAGGIGDTGLTPTSGTVKIEWKRASVGNTKGEIFKL